MSNWDDYFVLTCKHDGCIRQVRGTRFQHQRYTKQLCWEHRPYRDIARSIAKNFGSDKVAEAAGYSIASAKVPAYTTNASQASTSSVKPYPDYVSDPELIKQLQDRFLKWGREKFKDYDFCCDYHKEIVRDALNENLRRVPGASVFIHDARDVIMGKVTHVNNPKQDNPVTRMVKWAQTHKDHKFCCPRHEYIFLAIIDDAERYKPITPRVVENARRIVTAKTNKDFCSDI